jgi:hypothetical protein
MSIDFSQEKKITERKIRKFTDKGLTIPKDLLSYYNNLSEGTGSAGGSLTQAQAQAAFEAALQNQNQAEFEDFVFTDANNITFIRRSVLNEETGVFTASLLNVDGTVASATPLPPLVAGTSPLPPIIKSVTWYAVTAGPGYAIGDRVIQSIRSNGTSTWFNETTNTVIAVAPVLNTLSDTLESVVINSTLTVVPAAVETTFVEIGSTPGTSTNVNIPTIGGRKANYVYITVAAGTLSKAALRGLAAGAGGSRLLSGVSLGNRISLNLSPALIGSGYYLPVTLNSLSVQTWSINPGVTLNLAFRYVDGNFEEGSQHDLTRSGVNYAADAQVSTNTPGQNIPVPVIGGYTAWAFVGNTTNLTINYQILVSLNSVNTWLTLSQMVVPANQSNAVMDIPSHGIHSTRFTIAGTFTNYSYSANLNNAR